MQRSACSFLQKVNVNKFLQKKTEVYFCSKNMFAVLRYLLTSKKKKRIYQQFRGFGNDNLMPQDFDPGFTRVPQIPQALKRSTMEKPMSTTA